MESTITITTKCGQQTWWEDVRLFEEYREYASQDIIAIWRTICSRTTHFWVESPTTVWLRECQLRKATSKGETIAAYWRGRLYRIQWAIINRDYAIAWITMPKLSQSHVLRAPSQLTRRNESVISAETLADIAAWTTYWIRLYSRLQRAQFEITALNASKVLISGNGEIWGWRA